MDEVTSAKRDDPFCPVAVIVPTQAVARRLQSRLADRGAWVNIHFHTFLTLAFSILKSGNGATPTIAPRAAHLLLLADSLQKFAPENEFIRYFLTYESCHDRLLSLFSRFVSYRVHQAPGRRDIERSLFEVFRAFMEEKASRGVMDAEDLIASALRALSFEAGEGVPDILFLYGFYDLNPVQREIVETLDRKRVLLIFSPGGPSSTSDDFRADTTALYMRLSRHVSGTEASYIPAADETVFVSMARDLFSIVSDRKHKPGQSISLVTASGRHGEAQAVALEIIRQKDLDRSLRWSDIGVTMRNLGEFGGYLKDAFEEFSIPAFFDGGTSALQLPEIRFFSIMLSAIKNRLRRNDIAFLLSSDLFSWPNLSKEGEAWVRDNAHLIEAVARQYAVVSGKKDWSRPLAAGTSAPPPTVSEADDDESSPDRLTERIGRYLAVAGPAIRTFLDDLDGIPEEDGPESYRGRFLSLIDTYMKPIDSSPGHGLLTKVLDTLSGASIIREKITKHECLSLLERQITETMSPLSGQPDAVFVSDIMGVRGLAFDLLLLIGMNERVFPRTPIRDPLLTDETSHSLGLPSASQQLAEDRYLFGLIVASAKKKLVISFQRSDDAGRAAAPSSFVRELFSRVVVDGSAVDADFPPSSITRGYPRLIQADPDFSRHRRWDTGIFLCLDWAKTGDHTKVMGLINQSAFLRRGLAAEAERASDKPFSQYDGLIGPAPEILDAVLPLSFQKIETYAGCPFEFFMRYLLVAEQEPDPEEDLDVLPREMGRIYHRTLFSLFSVLIEKRRFPGPGLGREVFSDMVKDAVKGSVVGTLGGRVPLLVLRARQEHAVEILDRLLEREGEHISSGYIPTRLEEVFGISGADFSIQIGGRALPFVGRIDRIDVDERRRLFFVVDYKRKRPSGARKLVRDIEDGSHVQLPLYLAAAQTLIGGGFAAGGGALVYLEGDDKKEARETLDGDEYRGLWDTVVGNIDESVRAIERGDFSPRKEDACMFCSYKDLCRSDYRALNRMRRTQTGAAGRPEASGVNADDR